MNRVGKRIVTRVVVVVVVVAVAVAAATAQMAILDDNGQTRLALVAFPVTAACNRRETCSLCC